MPRRDYSGAAISTELASGISAGATSAEVTDSTGWPTGGANGPFFATFDLGGSGEERVLVGSRTGNLLENLTRGVDGTSASTHSAGVSVVHGIAATDSDEANEHINETTLDHHTQYMQTDGTRHDLAARHEVGTVVPTAAPGDITAGATAAEGVATTGVRSDHGHGVPSGAPVSVGMSLSEGVSDQVARRDHRHTLGDVTVPNLQVFTTNGTWSKPSGLRAVRVRLVGGGGSGGGVGSTSGGESAAGGGGGGGGYSEKIIPAASLGASESVTVGSGGAQASAGSGGNSGATSSFGAHLSASGGGAGSSMSATSGGDTRAGGVYGAGFDGDINANGDRGGTGRVTDGAATFSNYGGGSVLGGSTPNTSLNSNGLIGRFWGGGGSGANNGGFQSARSGGAGRGGIVIVEEIF